MDKTKSKAYQILLRRLGQLFNIVKLYTPEHPTTQAKSKEVFEVINGLISKEEALSFSESGGVFLVNKMEIDFKDDRMMKIFIDSFHELQLGTLELEKGITLEDFNILVRVISQRERLQGEKQIREYLEKKGAKHIVPLFAAYKLVREDEKVIQKRKIVNIEEVPIELVNKFSKDLNDGDVSKRLKKEDKIYRFLTHDPDFLSQYTFQVIKEQDKDPYEEFEKILILIGDYLIDEISNTRIEKVNHMVMDELKNRLLSLCEQKKDVEYCKIEVQKTFTKIRVAMQLRGLVSLYKKNKKGLESTLLKIKEILETLPKQSQLYSKTKKDLEAIGMPHLDTSIFKEAIKLEKRNFRRLEIALEVKYRIVTDTKIGEQKDATSWNMGLGGICLETENALSVQTRLSMDISLPTQPKPFSIEGTVVWCKKEEGNDLYSVGLEFPSLKENVKSALTQFLEGIESEEKLYFTTNLKLHYPPMLP